MHGMQAAAAGGPKAEARPSRRSARLAGPFRWSGQLAEDLLGKAWAELPGVQAMVESLLKEYPNILVLRVRMPIVEDLLYQRNFITKIIRYEKVCNEHVPSCSCLVSGWLLLLGCRWLRSADLELRCTGGQHPQLHDGAAGAAAFGH